MSGSAWADVIHDHLGGLPPQIDLAAEHALAEVLVAASERGLAAAAHDLSEGGLAAALAEACTRFGVGADADLTAVAERDGVDLATLLLSESSARAIIAVPAEQDDALVTLCAEHGVPQFRIGTTGGSSLTVTGLEELTVAELHALREDTLRRQFG